MSKSVTALLLAGIFLGLGSGCQRKSAEDINQSFLQTHSTQTPLSDQDEFFLIWAEIIAKTEAINKKAKEIILEKNLQEDAHFSPSWLGLKNLPENKPAQDDPYDIYLEATIGRNTTWFWIHIRNDVPTTGATLAFAASVEPKTRQPIFYPRTTETEARIQVTALKKKNDLQEEFLTQWWAREKAKQDAKARPRGTPTL
jgi:hypothetical protein